MPMKARQPCRVGGCPHMRPCPVHPARKREDRRPPASVRGYDYTWKVKRDQFIKDNPICEDCGRPSVVPDHYPKSRRQLLAEGIADPDLPQYLRPRCWSCHSARTAREDGGYGNGRRKGRGA